MYRYAVGFDKSLVSLDNYWFTLLYLECKAELVFGYLEMSYIEAYIDCEGLQQSI